MRPRFVWQPELRDAPRERNANGEVPDDLASAARSAAAAQVEEAPPDEADLDDLVALEEEPIAAGASDAPLAAPSNPPSPAESPRRITLGAVAVGLLLGIAAAFLIKPKQPIPLRLDRGLGERASELARPLDRPSEGPAPPASATDDDHVVETVLDLDQVGARAAPPTPTPAPRVRPRVSVEYRPYRSVPLRPGEKSVAFPPVPSVSAVRP